MSIAKLARGCVLFKIMSPHASLVLDLPYSPTHDIYYYNIKFDRFLKKFVQSVYYEVGVRSVALAVSALCNCPTSQQYFHAVNF